MSEDVQSTVTGDALLRDQLARGDAAIIGARPVLRHLLINRDRMMFCEEVQAKVRGMLQHVAWQMVATRHGRAEEDIIANISDRNALVDEHANVVAAILAEDSEFLSHIHALALEGQMINRLQRIAAIDGVTPPLIQHLAASPDAKQSRLAMRVLAAQAQFLQHQRRMELPLGEIPKSLFEKLLKAMPDEVWDGKDADIVEAAQFRTGFEEDSRLGRLEQFVQSLGHDTGQALAIDRAGLSLFLSAVSQRAGFERNLVVYSCSPDQVMRLALTLRAAGLEPAEIEDQFLYLQPEIRLPDGFAGVTPVEARAVLAKSPLEEGA